MKQYLWDWAGFKRVKSWVAQLSERYHVNCFLTSSHMIVPGHMTVKAIVMLLVKTTYTAFNSPMFFFPLIWKLNKTQGHLQKNILVFGVPITLVPNPPKMCQSIHVPVVKQREAMQKERDAEYMERQAVETEKNVH